MSLNLNHLGLPGGPAVADDQGDLSTCTRFALSKAICEGFYTKRWNPNEELDVDQACVTTSLLQVPKDGDGKWPTDFHKTRFQFQEQISKSYWDTMLFVDKLDNVKEIEAFKRDMSSSTPSYTYLCVYLVSPGNLHSIFITGWDPIKQELHCLNSHGLTKNPKPRIPISQAGNILYRVRCTAKKMPSKLSSNEVVTSQVNTNQAPITSKVQSNPRTIYNKFWNICYNLIIYVFLIQINIIL